MNLAVFSIRYRAFVMALTFTMLAAGLWSYSSIGRLEDPEFTIKEALIVTRYPGATPEEVAEEVTDEIESAVQRMGQMKRVTSHSEPGRSTVSVEIKDRFTSADLPQIWDELRRRVHDVQSSLPPGAQPSVVIDDFGDVYGVYYAIYGDGFSYADLRDHADLLRRELLLVRDVGRVELFGDQQEVVYIEFQRERLAQLGIPPEVLYASLEGQNLVTPAGRILSDGLHIRLDPTGAFQSVQDIEDLLILQSGDDRTRLYLRDVARVYRGYADPPSAMMLFNGRPAIGLAISTVQGGNVVRMGEAVEARMQELLSQTPIGIELGLIAHQSETVTEAVNNFVVSLAQAIAIVVGVLMFSMGLRSGLIIGSVLLLTVLATLVVMKLTGILMERISLGALIIALGMLVDNTIVIVEGMQVGLRKGLDRIEAARVTVAQTAGPLFGATIIGVLSFAAIGLSQDSTGEYCRSLFLVLLYSLMLSWLLGVTLTPLLGYWFLKAPSQTGGDPYGGVIYRVYLHFLDLSLRFRGLTAMALITLLALGIFAFGKVERSFFPPSTRAQFMLHVWLPQGTHIERTAEHAEQMTEYVRSLEGVTDVAATVGSGGMRFLLTFTPEEANTAYTMLLVSVEDAAMIDGLMREIEPKVRETFQDVRAIARRFALGPSQLQKIEIRVRGPEPDEIQRLAGQVREVLYADSDIIDVMDDWRDRTLVVRPLVSERRARDAGLTRREIAATMQFNTQGLRIGTYREGDLLLPIIARPPDGERERLEHIRDAQIWSPAADRRIPLSQVVSGFETVSEHSIHRRRDRLPTLTVSADAASGDANGAVSRLREPIASIPLPEGYTIEWGGDDENSRRAQTALALNFPPVALLVVLTLIALFNGFRNPLIILLTIPLSIIGVAFGLLFASQPFGFMALLGFLSLAGMLIKNAIVLIDELNLQRRQIADKYKAVLLASVSRTKPVAIAALTTVLGMIPLLGDQFFVAMAVTIMAGLTFATVLTLVVVPVMYAAFFGISPTPEDPSGLASAESAAPPAPDTTPPAEGV